VLNASGETAQSRRNGCSIRAVEVRNLGRNTQQINCNDKLDEDEISGTTVGKAGTTAGDGANETTDTQITTLALIDAVVESYENTASFKKTAAELKISTAKVRKALLTAGVWTNETAALHFVLVSKTRKALQLLGLRAF